MVWLQPDTVIEESTPITLYKTVRYQLQDLAFVDMCCNEGMTQKLKLFLAGKKTPTQTTKDGAECDGVSSFCSGDRLSWSLIDGNISCQGAAGRKVNSMLQKQLATLALVVVVCACQGNAIAEPPKKLDVRTMADWSIVVAKTATESEKYAAEEFRDFFAEATGHCLSIRPGSTSETKNVFIGASDALTKSNIAHVLDREYAEEELRIIIELDNIAIVGGRPRGVLFGVYQFLEDAMGVRFLAKDYTYVPRYAADDADKRRGQLQAMDYSYNPPVECRHVSFGDLQDKTGQFAARLRVNGRYSGDGNPPKEWRQKLGGHNRKGLILHNITAWTGFSQEEHPEYFALGRDGKRHNAQPCFSHPDVIDRMTERVLAALKDYGPNSQIAMAQWDASLCECERCRDLVVKDGRLTAGSGGESWGAPMFLAINHVAREVAKVRPDVTIATYAYAPSARPPLNIQMEPNVRIQYATYNACQIHPFDCISCPNNMKYSEDLRQWGRISNGMMYWYYGMGSFTDFFAPPLVLRMAGPHIRTLIANNGKSFFIQGDPIIFAELVQYVYAKLLWDPRVDTFDVINEFVDLYYGKAAGPVAEFLRLADNELRRHSDHPNCNGPNIFAGYGYSQELGWHGIELFDEALALADTPELKSRVEKASLVPWRMSLGVTWLGQTPEGMTEEDKADYRRSARKVFELCKKHNIVAAHEARRMVAAHGDRRIAVDKAIRKALKMEEDEPF